MGNNYVSKHSKNPSSAQIQANTHNQSSETKHDPQRRKIAKAENSTHTSVRGGSSITRPETQVRRKTKTRRNSAVIFLLFAIIFVALAVLAYLAFAVFGLSLSSVGKAEPTPQQDSEEILLATPAPTPEPTPEPTPAPTPEPKYVYTSVSHNLSNNGLFFSPDAFNGTLFYASTSKVADDGLNYIEELHSVDQNGTVTKLTSYKTMNAPGNTKNWQNFYSGSELSSIAVDSAGEPVVLECTFLSGSDSEAEYYEKHFYAKTLDSSGNEKSSVELLPGDTPISASQLKIDGNGNYLLMTDTGVAVFSPEGSLSSTASTGGYPSRLVRMNNGQIGLVQWYSEGQTLDILSADGTAFEDSIPLPDSAMTFADGGGDYAFFYSSGVDLIGVRADTFLEETVFNWSSVSVSGSRVNNLGTADGKTFCCMSNRFDMDTNSYSAEVTQISPVPEDQIATEHELILASVNPVEDLQDAVADYNRSQDNIKIILKTFELADTDSGNVEALRNFSEEELNGHFPDLIDLTGMPYTELAFSGLLEELGQYLDADSDLSRDDLIPSIRSALEINGKIYGTCSGFNISTVIGPQNVLGNKTSWTYDEYRTITSTMGEGVSAFSPYDIQYSILYDSLGINMSRFINWNDKTCDFNNQDFVKMLEFVKKFPAEYPEDNINDDTALETGRQFLKRQSLFTYDDIILAGNEFKKNVTLIGLPTLTGSGNNLNLYMDFAMSSSCADKDAAWQFLRRYFTEEYQEALWYFPSNAKAFAAGLEAAKQIQTDSSGEKIPRASVYTDGAEPISYYQLTDEQAAVLQNLVESAAVSTGNEAIFNIIYDKVSGYLTGNDTAAGVAGFVQDAVASHLAG